VLLVVGVGAGGLPCLEITRPIDIPTPAAVVGLRWHAWENCGVDSEAVVPQGVALAVLGRPGFCETSSRSVEGLVGALKCRGEGPLGGGLELTVCLGTDGGLHLGDMTGPFLRKEVIAEVVDVTFLQAPLGQVRVCLLGWRLWGCLPLWGTR
jgi:hypothetical protein